YFLCAANTSTIIDSVYLDFGAPGWIEDIEYLVQHCLDPLQKTAAQFIRDSNFGIAGLTGYEKLNKTLWQDFCTRAKTWSRDRTFDPAGTVKVEGIGWEQFQGGKDDDGSTPDVVGISSTKKEVVLHLDDSEYSHDVRITI
ncbi:hypothetical protein ACFL59_16480, partial [Planctomycetota bacterium]